MNHIQNAAISINSGELIVYPTETTYALGANPLDTQAIQKLFNVKKRDQKNPLSIAFPTLIAASHHVTLSTKTKLFADHFLPGAVTILCEPTNSQLKTMAKNGKIGIRIPDHPLALNLLTQINPITATSANISGTPGARTISGIDSELLSSISTIIDGGKIPGGKSTVVDVDESTILRKGSHYEEIKIWLEVNTSPFV
jgi:L-threonylcarbamoyladenylate synthase